MSPNYWPGGCGMCQSSWSSSDAFHHSQAAMQQRKHPRKRHPAVLWYWTTGQNGSTNWFHNPWKTYVSQVLIGYQWIQCRKKLEKTGHLCAAWHSLRLLTHGNLRALCPWFSVSNSVKRLPAVRRICRAAVAVERRLQFVAFDTPASSRPEGSQHPSIGLPIMLIR